MAHIYPDTGISFTSPPQTNCIAVNSAFQKFFEGGWAVSSELVDMPSELQAFCDVLSVKHGVVYHIGEHPVKIPPGGEVVLRRASSIVPELLRDGSYVHVETLEEMMNKEGWIVISKRKEWKTRVELSTIVTVKNDSPILS